MRDGGAMAMAEKVKLQEPTNEREEIIPRNLADTVTAARQSFTSSFSSFQNAHSAIFSSANDLVAVAFQVEERFKELEEREEAMRERERKLREEERQVVVKRGELEEREKKWEEMEQSMVRREQELIGKQVHWAETEKIMEQNASKLPAVIQMNVGGKRFAASKSNLLKYKGSYFESIVQSNNSQLLPGTNEIFIDRDPKLFSHVINYVNTGKLDMRQSPENQQLIAAEFEFFSVPVNEQRIPAFLPQHDDLVAIASHTNAIKSWLPNKKFQLIYKASTDGFQATDFHRMCDNRGSTLTVIRSLDGYMFGGYTPVSWDSASNAYKTHLDCFLFTLSNPHNIPPTKYNINPRYNFGIFCSIVYGPIFGGGHDIVVFTNSNQNNSNYTNFPNSYVDTTGKGNLTFTGTNNFITNEIEVFSVI